MILRLLCTALLGLTFLAVFRAQGAAGLRKSAFGKMKDGQPVGLYTLTNTGGMEVAITNYGGIVVSIKAPDRSGKFADVVLGFDTFDAYLNNTPFFGALVGRYGNRIAKARFTLDGHEYHLAANDNGNTLHGGLKGFDKRLWNAKDVSTKEVPALELTYLSKDGEEGFPGNLSVTVTYSLTPKNELKIDYAATTDKDTVLNLTNHSYFNLAGQGEGDILSHLMMINGDRFTPVDATLIPTGELKSVAGTPLDFRKPTAIGARIDADDQQMKFGRGYDHNFVLNRKGGELLLAARVTEPSSGRVLEVLTTQPGLQFYTGNFLDGTIHGKVGKVYPRRSAFCMETQRFPDSPNQPQFPTTVLKPGKHFQSTTVFRFSTVK
ncbi:MAG TPA: aldose epimerase family protein [Bryobacteraceae bacterium]|nr:aldose epimerase family protein [Bryobacteraceae bacterium]